jgi:hypothetical protein
MDSEEIWNTDFLEFLDALTAEGVDFVLVGAFALAQHGLPRATGDMDVFVPPTAENATRVVRALKLFGAPVLSAGISDADFVRPGTVYQMGIPPRRIDVLTQLSGLTTEEALKNRVSKTVRGRAFLFLSREALLKNKRAAGRPKDLVDVSQLELLEMKSKERL